MLLVSGQAAGADAPTAAMLRLRRELRQSSLPDTARINRLLALSRALTEQDLREALRTGEQALALARRLHWPEGEALGLRALGDAYYLLGNVPGAQRSYQNALRLAARNPTQARLRAILWLDLGNVASDNGNYAQSVDYLQRAYQQFRQVGSSPTALADTARVLQNIAATYEDWGRFGLAHRYARRALPLLHRAGNTNGEILALQILAHVWREEAPVTPAHLDSAGASLQRALRLSRQLGTRQLELGVWGNLTAYYTQRRQWPQALAAGARARQLAQETGALGWEVEALGRSAAAAAGAGSYQQAYALRTEELHLQDSLLSEDKNSQLAQLQVRFNQAQQQDSLRNLRQQNRMAALKAQQASARFLAASCVAGLLLTALLALGGLYRQLQRRRAELAASNQALASANEAATRAARSKDRLYSLVAHDLRGPVTALGGVAGIIDYALRQNSPGQIQELPALVRQSVEGVQALLDNLLHWAAGQRGELSYHPETIAAAELLQECAALYHTTAEGKQIDLQYSAPTNLQLWADRNMIRTVLRNLAGNALKFTPPGGTVYLRATPAPNGGAFLTVQDSGTGLSTEVLTLLNTPDAPGAPLTERPRGVGTAGEQGTGLGLSLSHAFTQRHGGSLRLHSTPGQGTTAELYLPAA